MAFKNLAIRFLGNDDFPRNRQPACRHGPHRRPSRRRPALPQRGPLPLERTSEAHQTAARIGGA